MNFLDWMNMNMVIDIAFLVFAAASIWKIRKLQEKISISDSKIEVAKNEINILYQNQKEFRKVIIMMGQDLELVMKNPQAARRVLKDRQQSVNIEQ